MTRIVHVNHRSAEVKCQECISERLMLTTRIISTMWSGKSSLFGLSDLLRDLSFSVTDRIWNYISPAEDDDEVNITFT